MSRIKGWRWLKRIAVGLVALLVAATVTGAIYEQSARRHDNKAFPPPGKLVDIGGRRIHLDCRGAGAPTVILETGLGPAGGVTWFAVHDSIARFTRVCAYDRAGISWSDPAPGQRNGEAVVADLHKTLSVANEPGPFVLVGASLGGPYIMTYTKDFGNEVAGLVFVDAAHPDQLRRLEAASGHPEEYTSATWRLLVALTWTGLPRLVLPRMEDVWPELPVQATRIMTAHEAPSMAAALDEAAEMEKTLHDAGTLRTVGDRPLVVLTAAKPYGAAELAELAAAGLTADQARRKQAAWLAMQDDLATWSAKLIAHQKLVDANHAIQFDRPDAVITAVREVVEQIRSASPASAQR